MANLNFILFLTVGVCNPTPCQNGGNCRVDVNGNPKCDCFPGWVGENCTIGILFSDKTFLLSYSITLSQGATAS